MASNRGSFGIGRRGRWSGFGLWVVVGAWTGLAWTSASCGDAGEGAPAVATTVAAVTEPAAPVADPEPVPVVPAEPVQGAVPAHVTYGDAETVFRSGRYHDAMELFSVFALRHPDNAWGHYMLGLSAWKAGELARAETALTRAVELSPRHVKGLVNLARVLLERDRPQDALAHVEVALDVAPEYADAWRVMGNALSDMGEADEALEAYRNALAIETDDAWSMNNMGLVLIRQARYPEALPPLARATELAPGRALFLNNLGVALERSGYVREAADAYRAALAAEPGSGKASISLARVEALPVPDGRSVDVAALAAAFADDVAAWKRLASTDTLVTR